MNEPEKTFAAGLFSVLQPMAVQYDERIKAIQISQQQLTERIEQLTREIEACAKDAEFVDVAPYVKKLQQSRNRVFKVATTLNTVAERLQRMNRQARAKYPELAYLYDVQQDQKKEKSSQQSTGGGSTPTSSTYAASGSGENSRHHSRTNSDVSATSFESSHQQKQEQEQQDQEQQEKQEDPISGGATGDSAAVDVEQ